MLAQLTQRLVERALEVSSPITWATSRMPSRRADGEYAQREGPAKTLITDSGPVQIQRRATVTGRSSRSCPKRQRRFEGFDEKILALYTRGLSTREIERFLHELYGVNVSRELISKVTDAVMDDVRAWQTRPLDDVYPVVFLDAFILKIRENGSLQRKACYLALGVRLDGQRDVLGMWFQDTEGAKFWMHVLSDLKRRGVRDILICCVDGLTGFPEAIEATFPLTTVQSAWSTHPPIAALRPPPRAEKVAGDLKPIYTAGDQERRLAGAGGVRSEVGRAVPPVVQAWQDAWERFTPFLRFEDEVAAWSTRPTRSKPSTGNCAKRSRPKATSRARTPPAN